MNNNIDILIICPLGWDKYIWNKVVSNQILRDKKIKYIEYRGDNLKNKKEIYSELRNNINNLKEKAIIISASYGTVTLLNYLNKYKIANMKHTTLILLEGLEIIPNEKILIDSIITKDEKTIYTSEEEYINNTLDEQEYNYNFKKELLKTNLKKIEEDKYEIITKCKDIVHFLKLFSEVNNKKIINKIASDFKTIIIYSQDIEDIENNENNLILHKNKEENHLIMIENDYEIKKLILSKI